MLYLLVGGDVENKDHVTFNDLVSKINNIEILISEYFGWRLVFRWDINRFCVYDGEEIEMFSANATMAGIKSTVEYYNNMIDNYNHKTVEIY